MEAEMERASGGAATATVEALSRALELRDYRRGKFAETRDHCERVTFVALELVSQLAPELLEDPQLEHGFRLHDIGMLAVSDAILLKQEALTHDELDEIREHPWLGERIVAADPNLNGLGRQVIGGHHERWDGSGYPRRLQGTHIPLAARIFAVADAFDSMTRDQPWRQALPVEFALTEIRERAGTHFDPSVAHCFISIMEAEAGAVATDYSRWASDGRRPR
jgi:HD-GYP domain-containing protein (c-di-GMP phosphodiesterase class II)